MSKLLGGFLAVSLLSALGGSVYFLQWKANTPAADYETTRARRATIVKRTIATGSVLPRKEVALKPQVSGIVDEMFVEPGDLVTSGQQVARIKIVPNMVRLADAESRVDRAKLALSDAEREFERAQGLSTLGAIPSSDLDRAEVTHEQAKEELEAAERNLELVRSGSSAKQSETTNTLVRSTIAGMVLEVPLQEGAFVIEVNTFNEGSTVATVADMEDLVFLGKVDEAEVGKLKAGMELQLTIAALDDYRLRAVLEHVSPKGQQEDGTIRFEIRAALKLETSVLVRANYSATAEIVLEQKENVLALDESYLQFEGENPYVELETKPGQFERRPVETGLSDGLQIEIVGGITEKDLVKKPKLVVE